MLESLYRDEEKKYLMNVIRNLISEGCNMKSTKSTLPDWDKVDVIKTITKCMCGYDIVIYMDMFYNDYPVLPLLNSMAVSNEWTLEGQLAVDYRNLQNKEAK